jgi:leucyl/phenylalanyl-tRNA--protein transferase
MAQALSPAMIRSAYAQGIFPMTMDDGEVGWFRPVLRALFPMSGIRVSRSLAKTLKRVVVEPSSASGGFYRVTFDTAFEEVMRGCLRPDDNWISEDFIQVYTQIHREGWGHSCEVWQDERLVGGTYGIDMGTCFCAESMFHRERDCSKIALWAMVNRCRELGYTIFDAEVMNPHLASLGAYEIPHLEYQRDLEIAMRGRIVWPRSV